MSDVEPTPEEEIAPDEITHGLIMPFIVCEPTGPLDADSFVAGVYFGELDLRMKQGEDRIERYIPTDLVPQVDLLAMYYKYSINYQPWEEAPTEWTYVFLRKL